VQTREHLQKSPKSMPQGEKRTGSNALTRGHMAFLTL